MNTLDQVKSVLAHEGDATVIAPAFRQHLLDLISSAPRHAMLITHLGRQYTVLAAFPDTREGTEAANRYLRTVLKTAGAVEALVLLPLIERAAALARDIDALRAAMATTE